eukprot:12721618-Prorocentrum_lima.AAC.1
MKDRPKTPSTTPPPMKANTRTTTTNETTPSTGIDRRDTYFAVACGNVRHIGRGYAGHWDHM